MRGRTVMHDDLPSAEMRMAKRRSDEENASGNFEVGRELAARNHALQVCKRRSEEGSLTRNNQQGAVAQRVRAGIEGHGDEFLRLEPVECLLARLVEGLAETLFVGWLVGRQRIADHHRIGIATAHGRIREIDGETIARLGDDRFDDAALAVGASRKVEDGFVHAVIITIAEAPVGGSGGAAEGPVEQLRTVLGDLHERSSAQDFANIRGQIEFGP